MPGWRAPSSRRPALRDCALVIPTRDRGDEVERLLDTLLAAPDPPGEVVVVDSDPARELGVRLRAWTARSPAPFALVYVASPRDRARQRNVGVDLATRDFIFFLDPDCVPLPGFFNETRRVFDLDRMGCVGGVCGVAVNGMLPASSPWRYLRRLFRAMPPCEPLIYHNSGDYLSPVYWKPFSGIRRVDVLPASACAWRRDVFADSRFSCFFHGEEEGDDVELSLRAGKAWTLLCCGEARVQRLAAEGRAAPSFGDGRAKIRNRCFIWKRHVRRPAPRHVARFWLGALAEAALDAASWCARPWQLSRLGHAAGMLSGIASSVVSPPFFVDPPARREYVLAPEVPELAAKSAQ